MLFVLFLFAIVLSVILRFRDCDYPFGIFKVFFCTIYVCLSTLSINDDNRDYCMEGVNLSSLEHMGDHIVPYFVTLFWFTYFNYSDRNTWPQSLYQDSTRFRYFGRSCITEEQMVHIYINVNVCGVEIICKLTRLNSTKQKQFGQTKYTCEIGKPK
jgi:hypothetical protein